jgi:hypothetical protein
MELTLESNYYAFAANPTLKAVVTVTRGTLDYSHQGGGPFRSEGSLEVGESHEFTAPTILCAFDAAAFELDYPPPPPPADQPPLTPEQEEQWRTSQPGWTPEVNPEQDAEPE